MMHVSSLAVTVCYTWGLKCLQEIYLFAKYPVYFPFKKKNELILVRYCVNNFFLILKEFINLKYTVLVYLIEISIVEYELALCKR